MGIFPRASLALKKRREYCKSIPSPASELKELVE